MKTTDESVAKACDAIREETGFEPGAEIRTSRLHEALGLETVPDREKGETDRAFIKRVKRADMNAIAPVEALRERLLTVHKVSIRATGKGSYRITPPGVQGPQAARHGRAEATRALRKAAAIIENVDVSRLTSEQRADRDAAQLNTAARIGFLTGRSPSSVLADAREKQTEPAKVPMPPIERVSRT